MILQDELVDYNLKAFTRWLSSFERHQGGCWLWKKKPNPDGYGRFNYNGTIYQAHRIGWEFCVAPLTPELEMHHKCHNRLCVNPMHLEEVSHLDNIRLSPHIRYNARRDVCKRGHERTPEDRLARRCLTCWRVKWAEGNQRKAEARRLAKERETHQR